MSYIIEKNEIIKENNSDITIVIIEKNSKIFNKISKRKYNALWKEKNIKLRIGKYIYNNEKYLVISLPYDDDITSEFITFYRPLVTIINENFNYDIDIMCDFIESSNNVIICTENEITNNNNINEINYININSENFINKLKKCVYNNSFENLDFKKITYNDGFEKEICKVKNELDKMISFNNTRYLAIKLLLDKNFYKLLNNYFLCNTKVNIIDKTIINKINDVRKNEITKILN